MAEVTPNLGLTKPELNDNITPTIFAENFELIDEAIHTLKTTVNDSVQKELTTMKSTFQAGVDTCYNGCVNRGATPSAKTPAAISDAIGTIYNNRYNQGHNQGYNQGVTDADNRANGNSVNYKTGYNNGHWAGQNDPLLYLNSVSVYVGSGGDGTFKYTYTVNGATSFRVVCNGMPRCAFVWGPTNAAESSATALFYDANSNQIGSVGIGPGGTYSIPSGTSYIVIPHSGWQGSADKQYNISLIGLH